MILYSASLRSAVLITADKMPKSCKGGGAISVIGVRVLSPADYITAMPRSCLCRITGQSLIE